ncbi:MAG: L,D-transpeptidase family protein [Proteobacteria bacterium]|nr:L,D-transpeptidase family protein [Pseudomonadota bacterium]
MRLKLLPLPATLALLFTLLTFAPVSAAAQGIEGAMRMASGYGNSQDQKNLQDFYALRRYTPAWQLEQAGPQGTKDFVQYIRFLLHEHGLNDERYPLDLFQQQVNARAVAEADVLASFIILKIAKSLSGQDPIPRSDPDHIWPLRRAPIDLPRGLESAVERRIVPQFLEGLAPHHTQYQKLREALANYRAIEDKGGWIKLIPGYRLARGQDSPQVPLLEQRLAQEGYYPFEMVDYRNPHYSEALGHAVTAFQQAHGLIMDGNVGSQTLLALNTGASERIDEIRANLARLRVTPPEAWEGIIINIPSFRLLLYHGGEQIYQAPVVVGRPDRASPLVVSTVSDLIINPAWYVPGSIAEKDILPKLRENPNYLEEAGLEGPENAAELDGASSGQFWQRPGPDNSLGRIKFNFVNRFGVYLHGTPHVELFDRDDRRQSSGCIRLKKPEELAEILMGNSPDWNEARLQERIDTMKTMHVPPRIKMPIKLLYWTVMMNSQNHVEFYNDVYQLDDPWLEF